MIEAKSFLEIDHELSKQIFFSDFAALAFRGMILSIKEQLFMALPPFQQNRLGKILLGVSIIFVVLFAITLVMNWISNPDMFRPVFGN